MVPTLKMEKTGYSVLTDTSTFLSTRLRVWSLFMLPDARKQSEEVSFLHH